MKTIMHVVRYFVQLTIFLLPAVTAFAQSNAGFTPSATAGCAPLFISFQNTSTGSPTSYKWDLGNGITSTNTSPSTTYIIPGSYTVKLIVTTAGGTDSSQQIIVVHPSPTVKFKASDTTGCYPLKVQFNDSSSSGSGSIVSWQWDFGSGALSTQSNPLYVYTNAGTNSVTLRIVNSNGCSNITTKPAYIKILTGVKAGFSFASGQGCSTPAAVTFTNTTTGTGALSYVWDFGDGATSTSVNPVHSYQSGGSYTVKLIATNSVGCTDTFTRTNAVNIGFVRAVMSVPDTVCAGLPFTASNISTPSTFIGTSWSFGDGTTSTDATYTHTFTTQGTYLVKLFTDFGSCSDSTQKSVRVIAKPVASFTAINNFGCTAPLTVTFNNTSTGAQTYLWNFGDNTTSTLQNPVHTYTAAGMYTIKLTIKNASGCTETLIKTDYVQVIPPKITGIHSLPIKGCLPLTINPTPVMQDSGTFISTYLWEFGDGTTSALAAPSHTYTIAGSYSVKLTITTAPGCSSTIIIDSAVKVGTKPKVNFSGTPREICAFTTVNFFDSTIGGPIHEWNWDFGDGGSSTDQNPTHNFNDTGYFAITLIAYNQGCSDTLKLDSFIHVNPPIAKFDTSFVCSDRLRRNFIDESIGATSWFWTFGDGQTSTQANPSHLYAAPGLYNVSLKVSNGTCEHTTDKKVAVIHEKPTFITSDTAVCRETMIYFSLGNLDKNNMYSYRWYFFGIGGYYQNTLDNNIRFYYQTAGSRPMSVVTTDILKCNDTLYSPVPIKTYGVVAGFKSLTPNTCYGNTVNFIDSSISDGIHPIVNWDWNFGDGPPQSYTSGPFSHSYLAPGSYDVSLAIKDTYGCTDTVKKTAFISVTKTVAKFSASDTMLCPSSTVNFTNQSQSSDGTYQWYFGDGNTSTILSPSHSYATIGSYTVKLVVTDKNGCTDSASTIINVFPAKAAFTLSDTFTTCPPLVVSINNLSTYASLRWDFGDGNASVDSTPSHIYTYPGSYSIKLIVNNNGGCTDSLTKTVVIQGPTGNFGYLPKKVCNPGQINYTIVANNTVRYIYDFANGNTYDTTSNTVAYTYSTPGIYIPKIILINAAGCKVPVIGSDTIKVIGIETNILSNTKAMCDSGTISFRDSTITNDLPVGVMWNFGDGKTSTSANPTHTYTQPGLYTIQLTANTDFGCKDTAIQPNYIRIVASPKVRIGGDSSGCEPANLKFTGEMITIDTSAIACSWTFGNGQISLLPIPPNQVYNTAGIYPVTLKVVNSSGCTDSTSSTIVIHSKPTVDAGPDTTICKFKSYTLQPTGAVNYTWTANSTLSCTTCANPVVNPDAPATYYVTGTSAFGCVAADSVKVGVRQPFKMAVERPGAVCAGRPVTLKATGADSYKWTPSLWLDDNTLASPVSLPDSTITYKVIGSDKFGCFKDSGSVSITVHKMPTVDITNGENVLVQIGGTVQLKTSTTGNVTTYNWTPALGLSCADCANPVSAPKNDITYMVTVSNEGKCVATDKIKVNLVCDNATVFLPNTFSPNGDGMNDAFYPRGNGLYKIKSFKVFNRWGQIIYDKAGMNANSPQDGWNGKFNGIDQPTDVYVYIMEVQCVNNVIFPFKGNITLLR